MKHFFDARLFAVVCIWFGALYSATATARDFTLGHQFAQGSLSDRTAQKFADLVSQRSHGQIKIIVYSQSRFGDERENVLLLRKGNLDFAITGDLIIGELDTALRVVNMPFIYEDAPHALKIYDSPLGQRIRDSMKKIDLQPLSWHYIGARVLTADRPVHGLADLRGLKLRLPPDRAWLAAWRALGASVQQVPFNELPSALKLGAVNAQENPPNLIRTSKLYEHQKYLMLTRHMPQRQFILGSAKTWAQLSASQRQILEQASRSASEWASEHAKIENQRDLEWLLSEGGMQEIVFDPRGVTQALADIPRQLAGDAGKAVYTQIQALR